MAKAKKKPETDVIIIDTLIEKTTNSDSNLKNTPVQSTEEVVMVEEKVKEVNIPQKRVKVTLATNHKCYIGGEWYYLLKDKQYSVPENVKDILKKAGLLKVI